MHDKFCPNPVGEVGFICGYCAILAMARSEERENIRVIVRELQAEHYHSNGAHWAFGKVLDYLNYGDMDGA